MEWISVIKKMEKTVLDFLDSQHDDYVNRKLFISKDTGIPMDILTVIPKR